MAFIYHIEGIPSIYTPPPDIQPIRATFQTTLSQEMDQSERLAPSLPPSSDAPLPDGLKKYQRSQRKKPERRPALLAQDLMTSPVTTLHPEALLRDARSLMTLQKIRHLPVISSPDLLVGILSDRDLLKAGDLNQQTVSQAMSTRVLTATPDTLIREIAQVMLNQKIHSLPILNPQQKIVGILSTSDLLQAIMTRAPLELWV